MAETAKQRGTKTDQRGLYAKFEPLATSAIERVKELLYSRNENIALGAAKLILERTVPARKAIEVTGENGEPIQFFINTASGFIPAREYLTSSSTPGYNGGLPALQSIDMAPQSKENNNSNHRGD